MSASQPIPVPDPAQLLQWALQNPTAPKDAVESVNKLLGLQVKLIPAGTFSFNQQTSLLISAQNAILNLPVLYQTGVPAAVATYSDTAGVAYSQTKMQTLMTQVENLTNTVNLLLAGERSIQNQPGAAS